MDIVYIPSMFCGKGLNDYVAMFWREGDGGAAIKSLTSVAFDVEALLDNEGPVYLCASSSTTTRI